MTADGARKLRVAREGDRPAAPKAKRPRGRPKTKLTSAIGPTGSEREVLVILRAKLAKELEGQLPKHSLIDVIREFRKIDAEIRAIDAREAEAAGEVDDDDDDDTQVDLDDL